MDNENLMSDEKILNTIPNELMEPNYYAVIPVSILENKNISVGSKLLYAEVVALSHKSGYCYATNNYLAERLGYSVRNIQYLLNELKDNGLIDIKIDNHKEGAIRKIYILGDEILCRGGRNPLQGGMKAFSPREYNKEYNKEYNICETEISHNNKDKLDNPDNEVNNSCEHVFTKNQGENIDKEEIEKVMLERAESIKKKLLEKYMGRDNVRDKKLKYSNEVYELATCFCNEWAKKFGETKIPKWSGKDWKQAKMLIDKIGYDDSVLLLKHIFNNWDELANIWKVRGTPSMGIILTFGPNILYEIKSGNTVGYKFIQKGRIVSSKDKIISSKVAGWSK